MTHQSRHTLSLQALLLMMVWLWTPVTKAQDRHDFGLSINASNSTQTLSRANLIAILTLQKFTWESGERIVLVVPPITDSAFTEFIIQHTGFYPYQLKRRWDRQRFAARGRAPVTVASHHETIRFIQEHPGALAFLPTHLNSEEVKHVPTVD